MVLLAEMRNVLFSYSSVEDGYEAVLQLIQSHKSELKRVVYRTPVTVFDGINGG